MLKQPSSPNFYKVIVSATLGCALLGSNHVAAQQPAASVGNTYGKLPLGFEANAGQTDERVKFLARGKGYGLFLTAQEAVLTLHGNNGLSLRNRAQNPVKQSIPSLTAATLKQSELRDGVTPEGQSHHDTDVLRLQLADARITQQPVGIEPLPGVANYFIGKDPAAWHTDIATFRQVRYPGVYRGVDLVYYGNQGQLEYDFVVASAQSSGRSL
jgi:hypothetical protein